MKNHIHKCLLIFLALFAWANSGLCADDEKDFKPLFNGKDLTGWHFSAATGVSFRGWQVVNGILENKVRKGDRVMDLISDLKFWNFVLRLEYKIPTRSNSGVFLRDLHEIQIFGDYDMREVNTICNGAIYNFAAPKEFASKPSGEWQHLEVTMVEQEITVILNGKKIHDRVKCYVNTRDKNAPVTFQPGPIRLQGTLGSISFRNIRIKEIRK
jgi:hypothetical protein